MKKTMFIMIFTVLLIICVTGCDFIDDIDKTLTESTNTDITCTSDKQYLDKYGYSYYIEGKCVNNGSKDYDYVQVEYICYDKDGNNLGTALDNTNYLLSGETWKFKAISFITNDDKIDHCDYYEVTGW